LAEIIQNATKINHDEQDSDKIYYGAPPPAPKSKSIDSSNNSECRTGFTLIHRFSYDDLYCINSSTAKVWERLGLAEIIKTDKNNVEVSDSIDSNISAEVSDTDIEDVDDMSFKVTTTIEESIIESEQESTDDTSKFDLMEHSDFPKIYSIANQIWAIVDYDKSSSVLIEGDSGIIMIDSLTSYKSMKKAMDEFKTISDKKIKVVIFTTLSPESVYVSSTIAKETDDNVEMVMSDELLYLYTEDYDLTIENVVTYPTQSKFSIDVGGIYMDLISFDLSSSEQTYISLPDYEGILVGDSKSGVFPVVLDLKHLQNFNDQKSNKSKDTE
jgi:hypothetical protein